MKQQLMDLLEIEVGFEVNLFEMLLIHQLEDGRWRVNVENPQNSLNLFDENLDEYLFDKLEDAIDFFLEKREEMKLGYDFERVDSE